MSMKAARLLSSLTIPLLHRYLPKPFCRGFSGRARADTVGNFASITEILARLEQPGILADSDTWASLLRLYGIAHFKAGGICIHDRIIRNGHDNNAFLCTLLIQMYVKVEAMEDARSWFAKMEERSVFSWNIMIGAYARRGQGREALRLFEKMHQEGAIPNSATFIHVLSACSCQRGLPDGKWLHARIICSDMESNVLVGNALISMYGKSGSLKDARNVFDNMPDHTELSWSGMIAVYCENGDGKDALQLFKQMWQKGAMPNRVIYITAVNASAIEVALTEGKHLHACILASLFAVDVVLGTALINMYGKCGSLKGARMMFDGMLEQNVITWNTMISVYAHHGLGMMALQLFKQMKSRGVVPNKVTCIGILNACAGEATLIEGKQVHTQIVCSGFDKDMVVLTALVNMYGKCGSLEDAQSIFEKVPKRDMILWTTAVTMCAQHREGRKSFQLFDQMQQEGMIPDKVTLVSILEACGNEAALLKGKQVHTYVTQLGCELDVIVGTALVFMYGKSDKIQDAWKIFNKIPVPSVVTWNAMIAAYAEHGHDKEALQFFDKMQQEGIAGDPVTFINILSVCANWGALMEGKYKHVFLMHSGFESDVVAATALVNMYGKCGSLDDARKMFDIMPERNVITWNAMIAAYSQHGSGEKALQIFHKMLRERVQPNRVTFVNVLSACSHAGLVECGNDCLISMKQKYGITPTAEHYDCIVDLLGRAGRLDAAEDLINKMPVQPSIVSWTTLLSACRNQGDIHRGERVANHIFKLDPENISPHIALLHLYAVVGRETDVERFVNAMKGNSLQKLPCNLHGLHDAGEVHSLRKISGSESSNGIRCSTGDFLLSTGHLALAASLA